MVGLHRVLEIDKNYNVCHEVLTAIRFTQASSPIDFEPHTIVIFLLIIHLFTLLYTSQTSILA